MHRASFALRQRVCIRAFVRAAVVLLLLGSVLLDFVTIVNLGTLSATAKRVWWSMSLAALALGLYLHVKMQSVTRVERDVLVNALAAQFDIPKAAAGELLDAVDMDTVVGIAASVTQAS